jgi:cytochrome c
MEPSEMSTSKRLLLGSAVVLGLCYTPFGWTLDQTRGNYGLGRSATDQDIRPWNIDVSPDGQGLPPGRGTVKEGARIYAGKCAKCHGRTGIEGPADALVGGRDTLKTDTPIKTVGSYWPYATTLFDYINRAMPWDAPQSLTGDEVYAVSAWLLQQNGIIPEDAVLDAHTLPSIRMPNRLGFIPDPRPDLPPP